MIPLSQARIKAIRKAGARKYAGVNADAENTTPVSSSDSDEDPPPRNKQLGRGNKRPAPPAGDELNDAEAPIEEPSTEETASEGTTVSPTETTTEDDEMDDAGALTLDLTSSTSRESYWAWLIQNPLEFQKFCQTTQYFSHICPPFGEVGEWCCIERRAEYAAADAYDSRDEEGEELEIVIPQAMIATARRP